MKPFLIKITISKQVLADLNNTFVFKLHTVTIDKRAPAFIMCLTHKYKCP